MNQEYYQKLDHIVEITLTNIYSLSKEKQKIVLNNFNPKNKDHLYFFHVALMARNMFSFPIEVDLGVIDTWFLNWKIHKFYDKIKRNKEEKGINVEEVLTFMQPALKELGEEFSYSKIYEEYYSHRKDKK